MLHTCIHEPIKGTRILRMNVERFLCVLLVCVWLFDRRLFSLSSQHTTIFYPHSPLFPFLHTKETQKITTTTIPKQKILLSSTKHVLLLLHSYVFTINNKDIKTITLLTILKSGQPSMWLSLGRLGPWTPLPMYENWGCCCHHGRP